MPATTEESAIGPGRKRKRTAAIAALAIVAVVAALLSFRWFAGRNELSMALRDRMSLGALNGSPAPSFTLTDQRGNPVSLQRERGHAVVLEFMDPKCTDICPIVSREYLEAAKLLGAKMSKVDFLAVNVNQYHESIADIRAFSAEQGLDRLPSWHFLTGSTAQLQAVWKAYGVDVIPNPDGDVEHSSLMYFIDQQGRERWLAMPDNNKAGIAAWGRDIATVINQLT